MATHGTHGYGDRQRQPNSLEGGSIIGANADVHFLSRYALPTPIPPAPIRAHGNARIVCGDCHEPMAQKSLGPDGTCRGKKACEARLIDQQRLMAQEGDTGMTTAIQRPALMNALVTHADQRGWVDADPRELAHELGTSDHDVVHVLWDLQKQGYLKFKEHHVSGGSELSSLRLTSVGRQAMTSALSRLIADNTVVSTAPIQPEEIVMASTPSAADRLAFKQAELRDVQQIMGGMAGMTVPSDAADYPLIMAIVNRRATLEQAANLAEQCGATDLAVALLDRAHDLTDLEQEIISLARAAGLTD